MARNPRKPESARCRIPGRGSGHVTRSDGAAWPGAPGCADDRLPRDPGRLGPEQDPEILTLGQAGPPQDGRERDVRLLGEPDDGRAEGGVAQKGTAVEHLPDEVGEPGVLAGLRGAGG